MDQYHFQIRATGILVENGAVLLVKQNTTPSRTWSLPGGRVEAGETLEEAIVRELLEETGLQTKVEKLLYVCDKPDAAPPILHISFLLRKIGGEITLPSNEFDHNPISDVRFVPFSALADYGFSSKFVALLENGLPHPGNYMGLKENIGL